MIEPKKLIGKNLSDVVERMEVNKLNYRVIRKHGLITADYKADRYNLVIDSSVDEKGNVTESDIISDCYFG